MSHKSQFNDWVSWVKVWYEWTIEVRASLCRDINFQKMIWYVPDLHSRPIHIETWHMSGWLGMQQLVMRLGEEGRDIMWICNMQHIITRSLSMGELCRRYTIEGWNAVGTGYTDTIHDLLSLAGTSFPSLTGSKQHVFPWLPPNWNFHNPLLEYIVCCVPGNTGWLL